MFGNRSINVNIMTNPGGGIFSANSYPFVFVFNADAWVALSYHFTPNVMLTGGIRFDFYDSALTTYNVNTGGLQSIDRLFCGAVPATDGPILTTQSARDVMRSLA